MGSWKRGNTSFFVLFCFVLFCYYWSFEFRVFHMKSKLLSPALVAHACNPSYSGGRDQGDHGSKPAQANSSGDLISKKKKKKNHKKGLVEWLKV
jgi:hypothetical protein